MHVEATRRTNLDSMSVAFFHDKGYPFVIVPVKGVDLYFRLSGIVEAVGLFEPVKALNKGNIVSVAFGSHSRLGQ